MLTQTQTSTHKWSRTTLTLVLLTFAGLSIFLAAVVWVSATTQAAAAPFNRNDQRAIPIALDQGTETPTGTPGHEATQTSTPIPTPTSTTTPTPTVTPTPTETQKVELTIEIERVHLEYAGDSAEGFLGIATRGHDGEIMLGSWVDWMKGEITHKDPGKKDEPPGLDGNNPQTRVLGPIEDFPNGGTQGFAKGGTVYHQKADCPVEPAINVYWTVWDDDSSKTARDIANLILTAGAALAAKKGGIGAAATQTDTLEVFKGVIGDVFKDGNTPLGLYSALVDIDDPCSKPKGAVLDETRRVDLKNTSPSDAWVGGYPDTNGWLEYKIKIRHLKQTSSEVKEAPNKVAQQAGLANTHTDLLMLDLGQPDEAILGVTAEVASPILQQPLTLTYRFLLNTDNNLTTGAPAFPERGADYELRLAFEGTSSPVGKLLRWNSVSVQFEEVPDGLYSAGLDTYRQTMSLDVELAKLGMPAGKVTAWGIVQQGASVLDVIPDSPETMPAAGITPNYAFSGAEPYILWEAPVPNALDVPLASRIQVVFSKAMARSSVESAFSITPAVNGAFVWQANQLVFSPTLPLTPSTRYAVTIVEAATDRVGTALDGDGNGSPGGAFTWSFQTQDLPLNASDASGVAKRVFFRDESIYVTGAAFPPSTPLNIYMIVETDTTKVFPLIDFSSDNVTIVNTDAAGQLPLTLLSGPVTYPGEFNIVVDLNRNGQFDPQQDRIDRSGVGFYIVRPRLFVPLVFRK